MRYLLMGRKSKNRVLEWSRLLVLLLGLGVGVQAMAAVDKIYTGLFNNNAISGYDAVAYFTEGKPVKGSNSFTTEYMGANWNFSSQENLDLFKAGPQAYAPQYGGYCAYAVANGDTASAEPDLWTIHEGKLYLNYSRRINARWKEDVPGYISKANEIWPTLDKE